MTIPNLVAAAPAAPVAPYIGGKRRLASLIIERLASLSHETYVEPFIGMGGVFLRRPFRARGEVINDLSRDVITLFRILQRHYVPFMDMLRYQITSRAEFQRLATVEPDTLTDLERAARFLYLQRTAFGGKVNGRNFGVSPATQARFDVTKLATILEAVHERLASVVIECLPYQKLLPRYDRPGTLFYIDPPYYGVEDDYGADLFSREDFGHLAALLGDLKGRFLMSINDRPEVRRLFRAFRIDAVATTYSIAGSRGSTPASELLITNVPRKPPPQGP